MLLAIDVRECWVVADMVSKGVGDDEPPFPSLIVINAQRSRYSGQCGQESGSLLEGGGHGKEETIAKEDAQSHQERR